MVPPRGRLDAAARSDPLALLRMLAGPPQVFEAQVPLILGRRPFGTAPLTLSEWIGCTAAASSVLWAMELRKLASRAVRRRRAPAISSGAGGAGHPP